MNKELYSNRLRYINSKKSNNNELLKSKKLEHRSIVSSLMYLCMNTSPDLSFCLNFYSRYLDSETRYNCNDLKKVSRCVIF